MSSLKNKVQLIGNVGENPDVKDLEGGKKVARFSVATNESYKNEKGEKVTATEWHRVVAWGKTAEIVEKYVIQGKEVAIEGKLKTTKWEDENQITRYSTDIICNEILLLGSK